MCNWCSSAAYAVYATPDEALKALGVIKGHVSNGKKLYARVLRAPKPAARNPNIDINRNYTEADVDLLVSKRIRELVDSLNITMYRKPKPEYIDPELLPTPGRKTTKLVFN